MPERFFKNLKKFPLRLKQNRGEHQLNKEPLRIDILIIKKRKKAKLKKNIAAIFKTWNLVEYKSPEDRLSVRDFYKVYAYAGIYGQLHDGNLWDMSITLIGSGHPRNLLRHFAEKRGYQVEERWPGVYWVSGDILPIQVLETRKLSEDTNRWLRDYDNKLGVNRLQALWTRTEQMRDDPRVQAYMAPILAANAHILEAKRMMVPKYFMKAFKENGWLDEWKVEIEAEYHEQIQQLQKENRRLRAKNEKLEAKKPLAAKKPAGRKPADTPKPPARKTATKKG
jgi:hypothetical protein